MRYFIELSYLGRNFHGWQSQPNAESVQSVIESAMSKVFRKTISIIGAGRTDTGVNARQMYAHFDLDQEINNEKERLRSLNGLVGNDIFINRIFQVREDAHARFDATQRTYKYFVTFTKNPFLKNLCWVSPSTLDIDLMNKASKSLLQTEDFTSFAKLHSDVKTNICKVNEAIWRPVKDDKDALNFLGCLDDGIVFTISADRFLRNMVRAIVGTLVEVGRYKITPEEFHNIILKKNRCSAGMSMPGNALFLWRIDYPYTR